MRLYLRTESRGIVVYPLTRYPLPATRYPSRVSRFPTQKTLMIPFVYFLGFLRTSARMAFKSVIVFVSCS